MVLSTPDTSVLLAACGVMPSHMYRITLIVGAGLALPNQDPHPTDGRSKQRPYDSEGAMTDNPLTHTISGRALI
jgi:hypothetical protein